MNLVGEWAALLFGALASSGVRDVVISPGSRSTPFVHAACTHSALRVTEILDERVAAFHALGRAKASGAPVALLCTSGTAPAHYLPAVIEASEAHAPLILVTADRPLRLQGCGASQTVDQVKLFGDHVRAYLDLGAPDPRPEALRALRRAAARAVSLALAPSPGPVHLNARADKPLEPGPPEGDAERAAQEAARRVRDEPLVRVDVSLRLPQDATADRLAAQVAGARDVLVVAGPAPLARAADRERVVELTRRCGAALLPEATSQLRFLGARAGACATVAGFDAILRSSRASALRPDLVISLDAAPISGGLDRWIEAGPEVARVALAPHGWPDPWGTAREVVVADVGPTLDALLERLGPGREPGAQVRALRAADEAASRARDALLEEPGAARSEAACVRAVVAALPRDGLLVVGNGLPVRHLDDWVGPGAAQIDVLSQRGAAGIDGLVAGAAGAAGATGRPTTLLVGDLGLLHDLGGLAAARALPTPLAIVVLHNDGGRIFEQLPIAQRAAPGVPIERFTTPHGLRLGAAASLFGLRHVEVHEARAAAEQTRAALALPGATLVEVRVPPHDAADRVRRLREEVHAAIAGVWP